MTQSEAFALLEAGHNVLLTGAAGTGKTYVLQEFIRRARKRGKHVAVTATTGLAATHLNGVTIHAWSGIGIRDFIDKSDIKKLSKQRQELIRKADILVIDEISMLHDFRLDMVEQIARTVREDEAPFGGLQVVICGDFFQLPPVNRAGSQNGGFVVTSQAWHDSDFAVCYLEVQYRQADDQDYTDILNGIRAGQLTRSQLDALQSRGQVAQDPWASHTRLLTTNVDVDAINAEHLKELKGDTHQFEMTTHGNKQYVEQLLRSVLAPPLLELKKGAQVMCIKNSPDRRYANGSIGVVRDFSGDEGYPVVELVNGRTVAIQPDKWELMDGDKVRASVQQLPLRLAWAITVHKSQGMTLDAARVDLSKAFVEGMGYVALSRVRGLKHLILDGLNGMALRVSPVARQLDAELRSKSAQAVRHNADIIAAWDKAELARGEADITGPELDIVLYERLKQWRFERSTTDEVAPYIIAHNALLELIAIAKPTDLKSLGHLKGMGAKKLETYGADILAIVAEGVEA